MTRPCLTVVSGAAHGNAREPVDRLKGGTVTSINHQQPGKHVVISSISVYQYIYNTLFYVKKQKPFPSSRYQEFCYLLMCRNVVFGFHNQKGQLNEQHLALGQQFWKEGA